MMKPKNQVLKSQKDFKSNLYLIYCVILFIIVVSCNPKPEPYGIAEFKGVEEVVNYSKTPITFESDSISPTLLMYCKDDVISFGDVAFFIADIESETNMFNVRSDDGILTINDKIYGISIPDSSQMVPWFANMDDKDLSCLQFLYFESEVPDVYYPYIKEIVKIKPDIGIFNEQSLNEVSDLLKIINPKYIVNSDISTNDFGILTELTNLEILWASLNDSIMIEPLPAMPKLKQVVLFSDLGENKMLTNNLFNNNKQIEKVTFQFFDEFDLKILAPLHNLRELVGFSNTFKNLDEINQHQSLEVLSIAVDEDDYSPSNFDLPNIRWMTFYENVTQDEFDRFVDHHPKLEVVELFNNSEIKNLDKLSVLDHLFGLTITDTEIDLKTIENLKNLKYLSLPDDFLAEATNREAVKTAFPGVNITANSGYLCLGSGWLLLLIPLVILFRILMRRKVENQSI